MFFKLQSSKVVGRKDSGHIYTIYKKLKTNATKGGTATIKGRYQNIYDFKKIKGIIRVTELNVNCTCSDKKETMKSGK